MLEYLHFVEAPWFLQQLSSQQRIAHLEIFLQISGEWTSPDPNDQFKSLFIVILHVNKDIK